MAKVLIADELSPRAAEILTARGIDVDFRSGLPAAELKQRIALYDGPRPANGRSRALWGSSSAARLSA